MNDQQVIRGQEWLATLFRHLGMILQIDTARPKTLPDQLSDFGGCWLTIDDQDLSPEQIDWLMEDQGQVLDAMQYLINSTLNLGQDPSARVSYTIEFRGLRAQRYTELSNLAHQAVQKVLQTQQPYELASLSAVERRLVHTMLVDEPQIETYSQGEEPHRCLVVCLATPS
ncbi:MAG: RNA-binding protein [Acaryochloridaceae cyanobacterium SU_2_1]|nr:RNA-binding protein [Acaryochloridaceae cyanobacterium SU_2_1]NJM95215.1 RNA-binding protein [Acaryochloridaceae cyanobacterium CSU_5_19]